MRILTVQHEPEAPPALLGQWAQARRHVLAVVAAADLSDRTDARADAIVSLGSDSSVHANPHPWVEAELALLRDAHRNQIPILGICFGAQALAKALGGRVSRARETELVWRTVQTHDPELVPRGPWFFWHEDEFEAPAHATVLSGSRVRTTAFTAGRSIGLQYHPEVDAEVANAWLNGGRATLERQGVRTDELHRQIAEHAPRARERAFDQFDRIEAWWSRSSSLGGR
jgi:GMP synthase-like glutamine amidotransferase